MSKPDPIDLLAQFLDHHTDVSAEDAGALIRLASEGKAIFLPEPVSFHGEVARAKLVKLIPTQKEPAETSASSASSPLSDTERATAIRALAGPELAASAEVLISSGRSVTEAAAILASIRATAPAKAAPRTPTIEQRMSGLPEFGGDFLPRLSPADQAKAGWGKAFEQAEAKRDRQIGG
ncbi:MAG: hypothetical protein O9256_01970 [Rhizobiaceae bacterium]|nr:hypothetical protein [Rhizobiaceae bacterium]MCZ8349849.1 hypothetical protein [Rhizobium sp.]